MLNIVQLEKDLDAKRTEGLALLASTAKTAEDENRVMTEEELAAIDVISKAGLEIQAKVNRLKGVDGMREQLEGLTTRPALARVTQIDRRSMGDQFVQSEEYRGFFSKGLHRTSAAWRSPSVEVFDRGAGGLHAATLTTDPASGGDLIVPQYIPGILPILFKRLTIADLLAPGTTDSNMLSYMVETVFTNAAAAVGEGQTKPESTLIFDALQEAIRKIAHWLPVTEEMLEDVAQARSYIDARLRLGVQIAEEDELLNGSGIAPHLLGLMNRPGLHPAFARVDPMTNADAWFVQMMAIYASSFIMPTGIIANPVNWAATVLMKTVNGEYMAGGPFSPIPAATIWGLPVVVTPSIIAGTSLVGAFSTAAQIFRKGGIRVEASNSHQDYFIKNLVAIRAEERLGLAVYRPGALGKVTALTGQPLPLAEGANGQGQVGGGERGRLGAGADADEAKDRESRGEKARR